MGETPQRLFSLWWVLPVAALLALLATACGSNGGGGGSSVTVTPAATGSRHVIGSPEAPLELIEYADFQ